MIPLVNVQFLRAGNSALSIFDVKQRRAVRALINWIGIFVAPPAASPERASLARLAEAICPDAAEGRAS